MPEATLEAVLDHGTIRRTIDADPAAAAGLLDQLTRAGIDFDDVAQTLEEEGVASFAKSFDELLAGAHRQGLRAGRFEPGRSTGGRGG